VLVLVLVLVRVRASLIRPWSSLPLLQLRPSS
jgi:hypothetical protein